MTDRVAVVTGDGSGIGRACALALGAAGYHVVAADIDGVAAGETLAALEESGGAGVALEADVAGRRDCHRLAAAALGAWGRIDGLVASAGVQISGSLDEMTDAQWEQILGVNLRGAAFCAEAVLPAMTTQGSGAIVFVSSINAATGSREMPAYDASKAGLVGLTKSLALRYSPEGVRVNAVGPGATITGFHLRRAAAAGMTEEQLRERAAGYGLLGRPAEPAEIAAVIRFLIGEESSFITGQFILADGGASLTGGV